MKSKKNCSDTKEYFRGGEEETTTDMTISNSSVPVPVLYVYDAKNGPPIQPDQFNNSKDEGEEKSTTKS